MNRQHEIAPQSVPCATYRLQFHQGFTLNRATELVPYFHDLGVSHIYASPLLKANPGSAHGYDVCDFSRINPELGTEQDLAMLVATLRRHGMGLVLDFVPNHMGIGPENPWWWDVLKNGRASRFADYFDIDWNSPDPELKGRLLLATLGDEYERVLERRELKLESRGSDVVLCYFEHCFPINPESLAMFDKPPAAVVTDLNSDPNALDALIQRQHYRLAFWRKGDLLLNYRRFFNISSLAAIRVENLRVFEDAHRVVLNWRELGRWDGIRIDHPDGLRDPLQYLQHLQAAVPQASIWVEKILEPGEQLPSDWPVAGTTGYDFLNRVGGLFLDPDGEKPLTDFYAEFTGEPTDFHAVVHKKKRRVLHKLLVTEVNQLVRLLEPIARRQGLNFTNEDLHEALVEVISCFPVYRTYVQAAGSGRETTSRICPADVRIIETATSTACQEKPDIDPALFGFIGELLRLQKCGATGSEFVMRFQQLTGPAMAKGVEDTTFYCFNRFIALNEVGGDPAHFGFGVAQFHDTCEATQKDWPHSMLATSTHDTKRSEDVRVRLALLSEIPDQWTAAVRRWSEMNEKHRRHGLPDRNAEYLFYQTLVGAWPLPVDRALAYMEKASREAKQHTSWSERNADYDAALREFIAATLGDSEFRNDLEQFVRPLLKPARVNSLAQTLIKLTAPGVPDIYQGNELWDLSLVDPDNRRPVDFALRERLLSHSKDLSAAEAWDRQDDGLPKLWLIRKTLQFRSRHSDAFSASSRYEPLEADGEKKAHVMAYARGGTIVAVVPRLILRLAEGWANTTLRLPAGRWKNEFTGEMMAGGQCAINNLLKSFPVALLLKEQDG